MKKIVVIFVLSCLFVIGAFCVCSWTLFDNESTLLQQNDEMGTISQDEGRHVRDHPPEALRSRQLKMKQMAIAMQHMKMVEDSTLCDAPGEEEIAAADDAGPNHAVWRDTWVSEVHNEEWTQQMEREIKSVSNSLLNHKIDVRHLSCRETVCRMFLKIRGKRDAEKFFSAGLNPEFHYGFQLLNPDTANETAVEEKVYNYELIVTRKSPASV
ncbi:MAG: hypothetical protein JXR76_01570 [Deltaproteobacteria bacterium]|nr:hypothetical protein [Deltaproteobacteria bacterium]